MRYLITLTMVIAFAVTSFAAPMAPRPELDIEGLIATVEWVPEVTEKGVWGMSGSLGGDRTFPAHYQVELVDCNVALAEGEIEPDPGFMPGIKLGKQEKFSVSLNHPADDGLLKRGMRIKVLGYHESGDEGGVWTKYRKIETEEAPTCPCMQHDESTASSTLPIASPAIDLPADSALDEQP